MEQLLFGFVLAILISGLAYLARTLSRSGAAAALLLGTIVFGLGGLSWAILLLAFFISSSGLSRLAKTGKAALEERFAKGSRRDAGQVFANGGVAALAVLVYTLFEGFPPAHPAIFTFLPSAHIFSPSSLFFAFSASLAAANADTWATELGVLSRRPPVLILSGRRVERGASGGITLVGTLAALGGAALIAVLAAVLSGLNLNLAGVSLPFLAVTAAGFSGSLFDSFLGATRQAIYFCPTCQKETERHPTHTCGSPTTLKRGWSWLNNDWVNVSCTAFGAIILLFVEVLL